MGKVLEKYDQRNNQKRTKKRCVSFFHSARSYLLEMISTRSRTTRGKTVSTTTRGQEEKKEFEGKVHQE
jgi:hypothetical protein